MPSLIYTAPRGRQGRRFELHQRVTSIGAGPDNDLRVEGGEMAESHAMVRFDGRTFELVTLPGATPFIVNGRPQRRHVLEHGDEVMIGATNFTFHLYDAAVAAPAIVAPVAREEDVERVRIYEQILQLSRRLLAGATVAETLDQLMDAIIELTHGDKGFLMLVDERGELDVRVARNVGGVETGGAHFSDSIVATVVSTKKPVIVADAANDRQYGRSLSVVNLQLCSVMCVPLLDRDALLGIIYVGNDNVVNLFNERHLEALTIFAAQASLILARAIALDELRDVNEDLKAQLDGLRFGTIIGACDVMRGIYRRIEKVAATDVSVLISGETGTGKELIAREIHLRSDRRKGPFVTINCGAIPENLLESELFGYVRGAFTGAVSNRAGKFQAADGGTLFLDEIGEMPLNLQVKILRALQDRSITRVGDTRPERVDIRVVAATNRDLKKMIAEGAFREDLYYRLNVVTIHLPPLRERGDDITLLARYMMERFATELNVGKKSLARDALVAIRKHAWPGNIRQLENHIRKALILSESSTIHASDLDLEADAQRAILTLNEAREEWQRQYIREILALNEGNRTKTARDLGVDPRTVFRFLEKEGDRDDAED
jgi:transcriptional regulator with GAF, ATPase, and Fis domain